MRFLVLALASALFAQLPSIPNHPKDTVTDDVDFICPMDKEVRSKQPGKCPRCGMKLVAGIADPVEYPVTVKIFPRAPKPGKPVKMSFQVEDPRTHSLIDKFEVMHEKLLHLFLVSEDLRYFAHEHPVAQANGEFQFETTLPQAGPYRVVEDFYPSGGTPQMHISTIYVSGEAPSHRPLTADLTPQTGRNLQVEITTEPPQPLAGFKTLMFFQLKPLGEAKLHLQPYIGAWGHMLAASEDLIDVMHTHPFIADGGPKVQFNLIFPREAVYRVWVQFQNNGEVNTVAFNIPVKQLQ